MKQFRHSKPSPFTSKRPTLAQPRQCLHFGLGSVYISGYTHGSLGGTNAGGFDAFVAKFVDLPDVNPEPGDLNMDGFVDGLDLGTLLGSWGTTTTPDMGELDGTPPVDGLDLGLLLGAWNPPPMSPVAAVPEPSSIVICCALALLYRGRSTSSS